MKTSDFFYHLPEELIAQTPLAQRDGSRMLVADRGSGAVAHRMFADFPSFIQPHDVVVVNRSRVIPARLIGKKADSGIACEVLLLRRINARDWEALVKPGRRLKEGSRVIFGDGLLSCEVLVTTPFGGRMVRFSYEGVFEEILDRLGQMPLPPYIHEQLADKNRYQTIYAKEDGSAAAPTAGLHFTEAVFQQIKARGAEVASILLHVGLGTFRPVKEDDVENHQMHAEWYEVSPEAAQAINQAKSSGGRVICVG
ncbi:MAG: tRNA preQ1(34) S-adenosylmethionine ribosyltransferase-isomerase QueA, partial [Clostridiales bacterium]|nr:tRNA preQ1(34) S-adenosylmethionine ribosyltransferase-isomerase QueA [Clostridiales bacterium]